MSTITGRSAEITRIQKELHQLKLNPQELESLLKGMDRDFLLDMHAEGIQKFHKLLDEHPEYAVDAAKRLIHFVMGQDDTWMHGLSLMSEKWEECYPDVPFTVF